MFREVGGAHTPALSDPGTFRFPKGHPALEKPDSGRRRNFTALVCSRIMSQAHRHAKPNHYTSQGEALERDPRPLHRIPQSVNPI